MLDRFSTKKLLLFAVAICTIGTFIFALAKEVKMAGFGRFLVGSGASFCFLSCIRIASRWFSPHRMAFVTGMVVVMAMLGGLVAQTPFALLVEYVDGWRPAVLIDASLGIIIYLAIAFIVQDRPPDAQEEAKIDQQHLQRLGLWRCIKLAALNSQNWWGGIYTSLMNLPVFLLIGLVTSSQVLSYPTIAELNPIYLTSTAVSIASICIMISGFIFQPFFGWIMEQSKAHTVINGMTIYTSRDFDLAMMIMPVAFIVALIVTLFIRETYCRSR